jgi:hypothetical protein
MAFLRRFPRSPYWFAGYTAPDGRRVQRSTKQSLRRKAQLVANEWEKAARLAAEKRLGEAQARRVLSDIYAAVTNEPLRTATARQFLTDWTAKRKTDTSLRTYQAYSQVTRDFLESLGERSNIDVSQITRPTWRSIATWSTNARPSRRRTSP